MGIYVFNTQFLFDELKRTPTIRIRAMISARTSSRTSSNTGGRWRTSSAVPASGPATIRAATGATSEPWTPIGPPISTSPTFCPSSIFTIVHGDLDPRRNQPPAKFVHDEEGRRGTAITSLVSGGCIISGAALRRSLLFTGVHLHSYARVENAVILPYVDVGQHARLANVVIDRVCGFRRGWWSEKIPKATPKRFRTTERASV